MTELETKLNRERQNGSEVGYGYIDEIGPKEERLQRGVPSIEQGRKLKPENRVFSDDAKKITESTRAVESRDGKVVGLDTLARLRDSVNNGSVSKPQALEQLLQGQVAERRVRYDEVRDARGVTGMLG